MNISTVVFKSLVFTVIFTLLFCSLASATGSELSNDQVSQSNWLTSSLWWLMVSVVLTLVLLYLLRKKQSREEYGNSEADKAETSQRECVDSSTTSENTKQLYDSIDKIVNQLNQLQRQELSNQISSEHLIKQHRQLVLEHVNFIDSLIPAKVAPITAELTKMEVKHSIFIVEPALNSIILRYERLCEIKPFSFKANIDNDLLLNTDIDLFKQVVEMLLEHSFEYTYFGTVELAIYGDENKIILSISIDEANQSPVKSDKPLDVISSVKAVVGSDWLDNLHPLLAKINAQVVENNDKSIQPLVKVSFDAWLIPKLFNDQQGSDPQAIVSKQNLSDCKILLIEDDEDLNRYYRDLLSRYYQVTALLNIESSVQGIVDLEPDLVICNVNLGQRSGFELLKLLKANQLTRHISVLLLSTDPDINTRIEGFALGANDYVIKPVREHELLIRVKNQLRFIDTLQARFNIGIVATEPESNVVDDRTINTFQDFIANHYSESSLRIEYIAEQLFVTSKQLERKVKQSLGMTPNSYLTNYRLTRSLLLLKQNYKVKDVVAPCGFSSHAYFSKKFKQKYGCSPSEYRNVD